MYIVDRVTKEGRCRIGDYADIREASKAVEADAQLHGADCVYYVEKEGERA